MRSGAQRVSRALVQWHPRTARERHGDEMIVLMTPDGHGNTHSTLPSATPMLGYGLRGSVASLGAGFCQAVRRILAAAA